MQCKIKREMYVFACHYQTRTPAPWTAYVQKSLGGVQIVHDGAPVWVDVVACAEHVERAPRPILKGNHDREAE